MKDSAQGGNVKTVVVDRFPRHYVHAGHEDVEPTIKAVGLRGGMSMTISVVSVAVILFQQPLDDTVQK